MRVLIFLATLLLYVTVVHQLARQCLQHGRVVILKYTCYRIRIRGYESFVPNCQIEVNAYTETYSEFERLILEVGSVVVRSITEIVVGTLLNLELVDIAVNAITGIVNVLEADET